MRHLVRQMRTWGRGVRARYLHDFVFIHINKTAGTSIEQALGLRFEHKTALEKRAELGAARWAKRFTFSFVRNPWDRIVSLYHYRIKTNTTGLGDHPIPFPEWVRRTFGEQDPAYYNSPRMLMPQWRWLADDEDRLLVDFVGRFETLEADFQTVCDRIGRTAALPHLKPTRRGPYTEYYDPETAEVVRRWFHVDIEHFGYDFGA